MSTVSSFIEPTKLKINKTITLKHIYKRCIINCVFKCLKHPTMIYSTHNRNGAEKSRPSFWRSFDLHCKAQVINMNFQNTGVFSWNTKLRNIHVWKITMRNNWKRFACKITTKIPCLQSLAFSGVSQLR